MATATFYRKPQEVSTKHFKLFTWQQTALIHGTLQVFSMCLPPFRVTLNVKWVSYSEWHQKQYRNMLFKCKFTWSVKFPTSKEWFPENFIHFHQHASSHPLLMEITPISVEKHGENVLYLEIVQQLRRSCFFHFSFAKLSRYRDSISSISLVPHLCPLVHI